MEQNFIDSCFQEFLDLLPTPGTRKQYRYDILEFYGGSLPRDTADLQKRTSTEKILDWVKELKMRGSEGGKILKPITINRKLVALRRFTLYLQGNNLLAGDPANPFSVPREDCEKWAPKGLLSKGDVQKIICSNGRFMSGDQPVGCRACDGAGHQGIWAGL